MQIDSAELKISGKIDLNNFLIKDHQNDTLIYFTNLYLSPISLNKLISNDLNFRSIDFSGLKINIYKYLGEEQNNLGIFIDKLTNENKKVKSDSDFIYNINKINGNNSELTFKDFNFTENNFKLDNLNLELSNFIVTNNQIELNLNNISFNNDEALGLNQLSSKLIFSKNDFKLNDLKFKYENSNIEGDLVLDLSRLDVSDLKNTNIYDSLYVDLKIKNSKIFPSNLNKFFNKINKSYSSAFMFESKINGFLNELNIYNTSFSNQASLIDFDCRISNLFSSKNNYSLSFIFKNINTSSFEIDSLIPEIFGTILPSSIKSIGNFKFKGSMSVNPQKVESDFNLLVQNGQVNASLSISDFSNIDNAIYKGYVEGNDINISKFINFKSIGKSNFKFDISGRGFTTELLDSEVTGKISQIAFNDKVFKELDIFGKVKNQVFDGKLDLNDPDLNLNFNGLIDFSNDLVDFDFNSTINIARLHNLGFNEISEINGEVNVKLRGNSMEDLIGDFSLNNFKYQNIDGVVDFEDLSAQLRNNEGNRIINIRSEDIISGILIGEYDFTNLKSSIFNNFGSHYTNYVLLKPYKSQNISFNLNFKPKFLKIINNNLLIDENTFLSGKFESNGNYDLKLESSFINFKDIKASNFNLNINNKSGSLLIDKINSKLISGTSFKLNTKFVKDSLKVNSSYTSSNKELNKITFSHTIDSNNNSVVSFYDMELVINNQKWLIDKNNKKELPVFSFSRNSKNYSFINANFISGKQNLKINISEDLKNSSYSLKFKDVSLENLTSNKNKIFFQGLVNGNVDLIKSEEEYQGVSSIKLDNLKANNNILGTANLNINASNDLKSFKLSFNILENDLKVLNLEGKFSIENDFYPLDLKLKMNDFNIMPFSKIGDNVITDFKGYFNSDILISGNSNTPNFNGEIRTKDVEFLIPYLNVNYKLNNNPKFILTDQTFKLNNFNLYNSNTNSIGLLYGKINHNKFKNWFLDLNIDTDNLLILNTNYQDDVVYYGKGFLNGNSKIKGPGENLFINVDGSTNQGTGLVIPIQQSKNIGDLSYLNFINNKEENENFNYKRNGLKVNLDLEFNKNATIEVILDSDSGSRLLSKGNGKLNFKINTVGNFNIFGNYIVDSGSYFYKSLGIVDREFNIKKGSSLTWNGNPYMADLNINANYEIPGGANPAILIQNTNFNRKIPTNIDVNLTGNLAEIDTPNFNINFPNTSGPIKSEIEYYLVDEEKKQKQAISLLYQNTFIDEISLSSVSSQAITNNLFQKASGIIDDIFTNSDDKMNVGINYLKGDKNAASSLLNRDRLGLTLKTEISDKILINGKIGVPVGGVEENVIIGDVQIEFLLNDEGNLKARFFNKENEYQYFANDIGYTQGMGISYELEFDSFKELFKKNKKKKSIKNSK